MRYKELARVPRAEATRWGGPAVSVLSPAAFPMRVGEPEVKHLSLTMAGTCVGCGIGSDDMESDGWTTPDNYHTFLCPSCQHQAKCSHCGLSMLVQKVVANGPYDGAFNAGELVAKCINPECSDFQYVGRISVVDTTP